MVRGIYNEAGQFIGRIWGSHDPQWRGYYGQANGDRKIIGPVVSPETAESAVKLMWQNLVLGAKRTLNAGRPPEQQLKLKL